MNNFEAPGVAYAAGNGAVGSMADVFEASEAAITAATPLIVAFYLRRFADLLNDEINRLDPEGLTQGDGEWSNE